MIDLKDFQINKRMETQTPNRRRAARYKGVDTVLTTVNKKMG